jgi:hypothetical protein
MSANQKTARTRGKRLTIALPPAKPRNPLVVEAVARKAGAMGDRRQKRTRDALRREMDREIEG